ncbi:MAG: AAA family ATPase [Oscillospiraceae bacterium]|jgi:AAA+ superfamily predicted ATPase|nr:AAA family ATPase [Oscillospiraceae bacterium]
MRFIKIEVESLNKLLPADREERGDYVRSFHGVSDAFYRNGGKELFIFVSEIKNRRVVLGAFCKNGMVDSSNVRAFFEIAEIDKDEVLEIKIQETTFNTISHLLRTAERIDYIQECSEILEQVGLEGLGSSRLSFDESICRAGVTKDTLIKETQKLLCEEQFVPELERIYAGNVREVRLGHPVHYLIQTDDAKVRAKMVEMLVTALHANRRVENSRYTEISFNASSSVYESIYNNLYEANSDGAVAVAYNSADATDGGYIDARLEVITSICDTMREHKRDVLTILCLPRACEKVKSLFMERLGVVTIVELNEDTVFGEKAKAYLRGLAKANKVKPDRSLYKCAADPEKGHLTADLNRVFDEWLDKNMRTQVYSQYAGLETVSKKLATKKARGSAFSELEAMIGLAESKAVINQALDFYKAQKLFRDKGFASERPAMHMVFTGNPGTAKTSVARLFARIMKENGLLSKGNLYEVGRADLVDRYVGGTAPRVRQKFKDAKGSVLFIDEAYSLVDGDVGLYGDEAINTIVQEMENAREDMVVIFAGYPDKMKGFLQSNPGLRSRIAFHVPFSDYDSDELFQITQLMATNQGVTLGSDVRDKLLPIYKSAMTQSDFGNGRFARNLFEKAKLKQASRLVHTDDVDALTRGDITTLIADDFEAPSVGAESTVRKIGFTPQSEN